MQITVSLFGHFRRGRFKQQELTFPREVTVEEVFAEVELPEISSSIITVNGWHSRPTQVLAEGDEVAFIPLAAEG